MLQINPSSWSVYWKIINKHGFKSIKLVYLTLDGSAPSTESIGDLAKHIDLEANIINLSYKDDIPDWLISCQQRACENPALRESISQYKGLINTLTGTDMNDTYKSELSSLLGKGDNLLLAHDIQTAMTNTLVEKQVTLWQEIESALKHKLPSLGRLSNCSDASYDTVKDFYTKSRSYSGYGIKYPFHKGNACLRLEIENEISYGVFCPASDYPDENQSLQKALKHLSNNSNEWWPIWFYNYRTPLNLKHPTRKDLEILSSPSLRKDYANQIAEDMHTICITLKEAGFSPLA